MAGHRSFSKPFILLVAVHVVTARGLRVDKGRNPTSAHPQPYPGPIPPWQDISPCHSLAFGVWQTLFASFLPTAPTPLAFQDVREGEGLCGMGTGCGGSISIQLHQRCHLLNHQCEIPSCFLERPRSCWPPLTSAFVSIGFRVGGRQPSVLRPS